MSRRPFGDSATARWSMVLRDDAKPAAEEGGPSGQHSESGLAEGRHSSEWQTEANPSQKRVVLRNGTWMRTSPKRVVLRNGKPKRSSEEPSGPSEGKPRCSVRSFRGTSDESGLEAQFSSESKRTSSAGSQPFGGGSGIEVFRLDGATAVVFGRSQELQSRQAGRWSSEHRLELARLLFGAGGPTPLQGKTRNHSESG